MENYVVVTISGQASSPLRGGDIWKLGWVIKTSVMYAWRMFGNESPEPRTGKFSELGSGTCLLEQ